MPPSPQQSPYAWSSPSYGSQQFSRGTFAPRSALNNSASPSPSEGIVMSHAAPTEAKSFPKPPFPPQQRSLPGSSNAMNPEPDYGEKSYRGSNRLRDKKALITGADSGIGRAVALAFAREGADVVVSYLNEHEDARETQRLVEDSG